MERACFNCAHRWRPMPHPMRGGHRAYMCMVPVAGPDRVSGAMEYDKCCVAIDSALCRANFKPTLIARLKEVFT